MTQEVPRAADEGARTPDELARTPDGAYRVRRTTPRHIAGIRALSRLVYPHVPPWSEAEIARHLELFPEGQMVAVAAGEADRFAPPTDRPAALARPVPVIGMAACLRVAWSEYDVDQSWREFTASGTFGNHDPEGPILYGAEVMVHPAHRRRKIASAIYDARERLARRLGVRAIRAGTRLRGYGPWADRISAEEYVRRVGEGEVDDPALSFQLKRGFRVLAVVEDYLARDPASRGWAAVVEWRPPPSA